MNRRRFLTSTVAAPATGLGLSATLASGAQERGSSESSREYYLLRHYHVTSGAQKKLTDTFLREALVPALNRLKISPVGIFNVEIGPTSPSVYVLMPSTSVETLAKADFQLEQDSEYMKAGKDFLNTPAKDPAYTRLESSLMLAFEGTKLTIPPVTANHGARVFELRTYESPTDQDHRRKVEMFHSGEFDVFQRAGFWQVFYGDTVIGGNQPNLTYMLGFASLDERNQKWNAFRSDAQWKKLTKESRFSFEDIVSNITNLILTPAVYSQI
jgi:hypothetical protein